MTRAAGLATERRRGAARLARLAAAGLAFGLGACGAVDNAGTAAAAAPAASAPGTSERLAAVHSQLDAMLARASACDADAQCRSVAVGAKSCGGPSDYRAFSARSIDPRTVEDLARQERDLSLAAERESGRASPCFAVPDPGARCVQNKCESGPGLEPPPAPSDTGASRR